jgi:hypothetical protein
VRAMTAPQISSPASQIAMTLSRRVVISMSA